MELQFLPHTFSVCKISDVAQVDFSREFVFLSKTDEELSLVCETQFVPSGSLSREDGWRAFRVVGMLDFSLVGILSELAGCLAREGISIFAVSTFNTDYLLIKADVLPRAIAALSAEGYAILE